MTVMLTRIQVDDYDAWKSMFDEARTTIRQQAKGHRIVRGVENPDEIFIQVEFESVADAKAAREQLMASGFMDRVKVQNGPTVAEISEAVQY
jgi:hypothetical protein